MEMLESFVPGQLAPRSAQYWVIHLKHRLPYKGVISAGETFPSCLHCQVRFEFVSKERYSAVSMRTDADLFPSE